MLRAVVGLASLVACAATQSDAVKVKWLEGQPDYTSGVTFGLPWPRGQHLANATSFSISGDAQLQSWATAYWPDGSLKWTGHAIAATETPPTEYTISSHGPGNSTARLRRQSSGIEVHREGDQIVNQGGQQDSRHKWPPRVEITNGDAR
jgi:hypothetical protein